MAALHFLAASRDYDAVTGGYADGQVRAEQDAERDCAAVPQHPSPKVALTLDDFRDMLTILILSEESAPAFIRMSNTFARIPTNSKPLRVIADSAASTARQAQKLIANPLNVCDQFKALKAHHWNRRFATRTPLRVWAADGIGRRELAELGRASDRASEQIPALRHLGLTFNEAVSLTSSILFFE